MLVVVALVGIMVLTFGMLYGLPWISIKIYPSTNKLSGICFFIVLFTLPFAFIKKLRRFVGTLVFVSSYVFGLNLWLFSTLITYSLWGVFGLLIGLIIFGVGVVPIAFLSSAFKGLWSTVSDIIFGLILTFGTRMLGLFIISKQQQQNMNIQKESEVIESATDEVFEQDTIEQNIKELQQEIEEKRQKVSELELKIIDLKQELSYFENEYYSKVGVLYIKTDELDLSIKQYFERINLLKTGRIKNIIDLEKLIEQTFKKDNEKIEDEKQEAGRYAEEYEELKEKLHIDEATLERLKELYRELVKKYHPDMARGSEEKEKLHQIMTDINEAYKAKDLSKLEELALRLAGIEKPEIIETLEVKFDRLLKESQHLDEIIHNLKKAIENIEQSDTYKFKEKVVQARTEGKDILDDLIKDLNEQIASKEAELSRVIEEFKVFSRGLI